MEPSFSSSPLLSRLSTRPRLFYLPRSLFGQTATFADTFCFPIRFSSSLRFSLSNKERPPTQVSAISSGRPLGRSPSSVAKVHFRGNGIRVTATLFIASDEDST